MFHIIHLDRNTGITTFLKGYFENRDKALKELNRIVIEYSKYPNLFSDYKISIVEVVFSHEYEDK